MKMMHRAWGRVPAFVVTHWRDGVGPASWAQRMPAHPPFPGALRWRGQSKLNDAGKDPLLRRGARRAGWVAFSECAS